jgi:hypothetical protein
MAKKTWGIGDKILFTRDYSTGWLARRTIKAGTSMIVTDIHRGFLGSITNVTVRDPKTGTFHKEIPFEFFRAA